MSAAFHPRNFVPLARQTPVRALLAETAAFCRAQRSFRRDSGRVNNRRLSNKSQNTVKLFLPFDISLGKRLIEHMMRKLARSGGQTNCEYIVKYIEQKYIYSKRIHARTKNRTLTINFHFIL